MNINIAMNQESSNSGVRFTTVALLSMFATIYVLALLLAISHIHLPNSARFYLINL
ncbi:hypothetical protein [Photorhabdus bodei]|uniref:Uncharacterized protein n=1 Tax=Photorhabdus bodei TaxID=2029681 RepID=A0AAW6BQB7_9GAMM|nr:hypothetical protein [Photorhabdus bodei]MDB6373865.1 hypothetical protein [Photorhabdus bodei]